MRTISACEVTRLCRLLLIDWDMLHCRPYPGAVDNNCESLPQLIHLRTGCCCWECLYAWADPLVAAADEPLVHLQAMESPKVGLLWEWHMLAAELLPEMALTVVY